MLVLLLITAAVASMRPECDAERDASLTFVQHLKTDLAHVEDQRSSLHTFFASTSLGANPWETQTLSLHAFLDSTLLWVQDAHWRCSLSGMFDNSLSLWSIADAYHDLVDTIPMWPRGLQPHRYL